MPARLKVPYADKDEVKQLGAWWNQKHKIWMIPDHIRNIDQFAKWLPDEEMVIVRKPYFVAYNTRSCWKCAGETPMIALGAKNYYTYEWEDENDMDNPNRHWIKAEEPTLFSDALLIDPPVLEYLNQQYPFYKHTYSRTQERATYANNCIYCKKLQGEWHNHEDFGGAFFHDPYEEGPLTIKVIPFELEFDYCIQAEYGGMAYDYLEQLLK